MRTYVYNNNNYIKLYNADCLEIMQRLVNKGMQVDAIITEQLLIAYIKNVYQNYLYEKRYYICKKNKMDKKELNKELINCLVKRSNLQREIRELYEDIEVLNAELYKKISRVVEARVELENLAERYIEIKLKQQNFLI